MYRRNVQGWTKHFDFMMLDLVCMHIAFLAAYLIYQGFRNPYADDIYCSLLICMTFANLIAAVFLDTFKNVLKRGYYQEFVKTIRQDGIIVLLGICYLFIIKQGSHVSRFTIFLMGVIYAVISYAVRILWKSFLKRKLVAAKKRSLLIVTTTPHAEEVVAHVATGAYEMFYITGIVLLDDAAKVGSSIRHVPVVADSENAAEYACREWVDEIFLYVPQLNDYPHRLIRQFMSMGIVVHIGMPEDFNPYGQKQFMEKIGKYPVLTSSVRCVSNIQLFMKRAMDIIVGIFGSLLTLLLLLVLGPLIYIHSPGPVFFKQIRVGKNGRQFQMYKFRSMYMDAEERKGELMAQNSIKDGRMFKLDYDPRIIGCRRMPDGTVKKGLGNFIRDFSLDEFPQFFNVLKGDMSVVGTRPPTVDEWEKYDLHHRMRLAIKPGITGLWQISGRSNITDFEEVVKLDAQYISDWSMGKDLKIFGQTVGVVLRREGAK